MTDYQSYLDEKMHELRVVCHSQWDYLQYSKVSNWMEDNFGNDIEGKYYAMKIMLHTVYYRKIDIEKLIEFGLNEKIYGEILKQELISKSNIYISNSEASGKINEMKEQSYFVPLLDSVKPHESGNSIIGDLVHKQHILPEQVGYHFNVTEETLKSYKFLIFVDDCIGSGNQLKKFWNSTEVQNLKKICEKYDIKVFYLVLVGFDENLKKLQESRTISGIDIVVCELLSKRNRVFSQDNVIWDKETNEIERVIQYFENLRKSRGISFLGYKKLDFAVILHDRLPNWSLPILWKENVSWKPLLRRKTSLL